MTHTSEPRNNVYMKVKPWERQTGMRVHSITSEASGTFLGQKQKEKVQQKFDFLMLATKQIEAETQEQK